MPDPTMTPEQFLREVGEIVKMPTDKPATIVSALRDIRADFDAFAEWAQPYLDSGHWAGHSVLDAIKQETIKRDRAIAGMSPWAQGIDYSQTCFFCDVELVDSLAERNPDGSKTAHKPDCLWLKATQAVGEEVPHG